MANHLKRASISRTVYQPGKSSIRDRRGPSAYIIARWYSDTTTQSVITPMIALDLSGTTHLSVGHNVALSQSEAILNLKSRSLHQPGNARVKSHENIRTNRFFALLTNIDSGFLASINRNSNSRGAQRHQFVQNNGGK
ncbi:protein FLOWERING LOCUS T-like [Dorcoceras hygrometricum]|uniref:Protein FLOWERING LOCUS T-like n=1 Tax=Dorcoceras hygrometricum TaxID=472368 RepID=A0A2Z7ABI3_9LAMI|nr:protein FLOWERING LOCUS T-like [Dorcoceras hygrometricum]